VKTSSDPDFGVIPREGGESSKRRRLSQNHSLRLLDHPPARMMTKCGVMPGLVPGIHVFLWGNKGMDGWDKPGHNGC
jgi:hypothetical protein